MDYTIIGGGVNLASRLESSATPGEILISYETYALIRNEICCEERGEIEVKGIAYPVETFAVIGVRDSSEAEQRVIREHHPNLKLELDLEAMTDDERTLRAHIDTFREASETGDYDAARALVADDAVFIVPGHAPMNADDYVAGATGTSDTVDFELRSTIDEVRPVRIPTRRPAIAIMRIPIPSWMSNRFDSVSDSV